jgi:hypothetical protein
MSRAGDVFENPVTGERGVVRVGTEDSAGELLVAELHLRPGGAVAGEHVHPVIEEHFTVLRGRVGFRIDGRESVAPVGERFRVAPGVDTASFAGSQASIEASLTTGFATRLGTNPLEGSSLVEVENVVGSSLDDTITGSAAANALTGGAGADTLLGLDGNDKINSRDNKNRNDTVNGGPGKDRCTTDDRELSIKSCE